MCVVLKKFCPFCKTFFAHSLEEFTRCERPECSRLEHYEVTLIETELATHGCGNPDCGMNRDAYDRFMKTVEEAKAAGRRYIHIASPSTVQGRMASTQAADGSGSNYGPAPVCTTVHVYEIPPSPDKGEAEPGYADEPASGLYGRPAQGRGQKRPKMSK